MNEPVTERGEKVCAACRFYLGGWCHMWNMDVSADSTCEKWQLSDEE